MPGFVKNPTRASRALPSACSWRASSRKRPIRCSVPDAEGGVHDVVDARPLVPGETAAETDRGRGAGKAVGRADEIVPGRAEFDLAEAAVAAGQGVALQNERAVQKVGMEPGEPVKLPVFRGRAEEAGRLDRDHVRAEGLGDDADAIAPVPSEALKRIGVVEVCVGGRKAA